MLKLSTVQQQLRAEIGLQTLDDAKAERESKGESKAPGRTDSKDDGKEAEAQTTATVDGEKESDLSPLPFHISAIQRKLQSRLLITAVDERYQAVDLCLSTYKRPLLPSFVTRYQSTIGQLDSLKDVCVECEALSRWDSVSKTACDRDSDEKR